MRGIEPVQRVIMMAMIGALELEHEIASGEGASKAERIERRFRSVAHELHCFRARHHIGDARGKAWRDVVHGVKSGAAHSLFLNGGHDAGMRVADHHWPGPEHEINEPPTIGGPQIAPLASIGDEGDLVGQLKGSETVAGNEFGVRGRWIRDHFGSPGCRGITTQEPSARFESCLTATP